MKWSDEKLKLTKYSAAAATLLAMPLSADAFIIYRDIDPDALAIPDGDTLYLDIDQNGVDDIMFWIESVNGIINTASGADVSYLYRFAYASALNSNLIFGTEATASGFPFNSAYNFMSGDTIGGTDPTFNSKARLAARIEVDGEVTYNGGPWNGVSNGFLGVKFRNEGSEYFSWLRLSVNDGADLISISDLAWDNQTDVGGIAAGLTADINIESNADFNIWNFNQTVYINQNEFNGAYILEAFDMSGRMVAVQQANGNYYEWHLSENVNGNIIIRISGEGYQFSKQISLVRTY